MADWPALKSEYVNTAIQYKELAEKHGMKPGTVRQRAMREGWVKERTAAVKVIASVVNESVGLSRAQELIAFNSDDVKVAKAIRAKAAKMLQSASSPHELRALSGAFESAQKIGRLALGASTENSSVATAPSGLDHFYGK
ncbi:MAG: hypothetical protein QE279_03485 [Rhodoferax sp.]|jgi:hypothetical protein|nr:hypothetical protein [Rhodoferax sp.]